MRVDVNTYMRFLRKQTPSIFTPYPIYIFLSLSVLCLEESGILSLVQGQGQTRCVNLKWPISVLTRLVMCVCLSLRIRLGESTMGYWSFNQERCISPNALILQYEIRGPISKDIVAPTRVHSHKGNICRNNQMFVEQIRRAVQCQLADKEKFDITIVCIIK